MALLSPLKNNVNWFAFVSLFDANLLNPLQLLPIMTSQQKKNFHAELELSNVNFILTVKKIDNFFQCHCVHCLKQTGDKLHVPK